MQEPNVYAEAWDAKTSNIVELSFINVDEAGYVVFGPSA